MGGTEEPGADGMRTETVIQKKCINPIYNKELKSEHSILNMQDNINHQCFTKPKWHGLDMLVFVFVHKTKC